MSYSAKVVADSISEFGVRLVTMVITLPRIMLAELNTHRMFSRNSASSRAIPLFKQLLLLMKSFFVPTEFGTAVGGMQAGPNLEGSRLKEAQRLWRELFFIVVHYAMKLSTSSRFIEREWAKWQLEKNDNYEEFVVHIAQLLENKNSVVYKQKSMLRTTKGLVNRLLEPFMWHTVIITATEWDNFFALRNHENAQLEIRLAAQLMKQAYDASTPKKLKEGEWHLPFLQPDEEEWAKANPEQARLAVVARCARVSYLTHDGEANLEADLKLAERLRSAGHMSPFEHAATPFTREQNALIGHLQERVVHFHGNSDQEERWYELVHDQLEFAGNFRGWTQFRATLPNQRVYVPTNEDV